MPSSGDKTQAKHAPALLLNKKKIHGRTLKKIKEYSSHKVFQPFLQGEPRTQQNSGSSPISTIFLG
jgi:hypothetical protein